MAIIQLRPRVSHRHILPIIALFILVVSVGNPGRILGCDWLSAAGVLSIGVIMAIASFYAALAFIFMIQMKETYFGEMFFGLRIGQTKLRHVLILFGVCLTYFAFLCRIILISAMEAILFGMSFATFTGNRLNLFDHASWTPCWWCPLTAFVAMIHTLMERRNLEKTALILGKEYGGRL